MHNTVLTRNVGSLATKTRTVATVKKLATPFTLGRFYSDGPSDLFDQPRPPPLDPQQQREFEDLVRKANTSAGTTENLQDQLHPDFRSKQTQEFEGSKNPVTGEVDGPKTDPLLHGDWSFGGRATDF